MPVFLDPRRSTARRGVVVSKECKQAHGNLLYAESIKLFCAIGWAGHYRENTPFLLLS
jgi:hypothetical protein